MVATADRTPAGTAVEVSGPPDAPLVVLIHGLGLTRHTFDRHVPALEDRWRVVRYDLWGHGESGRGPSPASLTGYRDQVLELLDHLDVARAALVGFSLGGMINRRVAIDRPERVSAIVVLNSPHERSPDDQAAVERRAADSVAGGPAANIDATLDRWFTPGFRDRCPDVVDTVRRGVLANEPDAYAEARMVLASGVTELIRPEPPIDVPTLVMTCERDSGSTPAMAEAIAGEIVGAELGIVPDLRHLGLLEAPAAFTGPIGAFLERRLASTAGST